MFQMLLKYNWKWFKIAQRYYVVLKTLSFMHMNSSASFHRTSDFMSYLSKLYSRFEKDALSSKLKYQNETFYDFMHMNSSVSFHRTSDFMSDLSKLYSRFEKDALSSKLKYQNETFYDLFLFITSIWTYSMYFFIQEDVICFIASETHF